MFDVDGVCISHGERPDLSKMCKFNAAYSTTFGFTAKHRRIASIVSLQVLQSVPKKTPTEFYHLFGSRIEPQEQAGWLGGWLVGL